MKLRNKKTGEDLEVTFYTSPVEEKVSEDKMETLERNALCLYVESKNTHYAYCTIKELSDEWEDCKE